MNKITVSERTVWTCSDGKEHYSEIDASIHQATVDNAVIVTAFFDSQGEKYAAPRTRTQLREFARELAEFTATYEPPAPPVLVETTATLDSVG